MSLYKIGSTLKILKTAAVAEDLLVDRPLEEKIPGTKIIEPKHSDFLYYRARAISAGDQGPLDKDGSRGYNYNGNFDYFPRKELEASYESFCGRNIFLDHNSESSLYSIGKIIDAVPVDDPETGEFYIELVGKIDRTLHPEICRKIETGELNSTSMGCSVDESICSVCGHVLHSDADEKCDHMGMNLGKKFEAEIDFPEFNIKKGEVVPCFSINKGIVFSEDSIVGVPADPSAVIKTVLSNMKSRLTKTASLSKEEQLDLTAQMEKLFVKLDDSTKIQLKAEFNSIFNKEESKESSMPETNLPNEETKKILSKISALEMEQLESYVTHKTKKANEATNKEVVADATKKEETFLSKIVAKVKDSFAAQLLEKKVEAVAKEELGKEASEGPACREPGCKNEAYWAVDPSGKRVRLCDKHLKEVKKEEKKSSLSAKFNEDKNNVLASTWEVYEGDKLVLDASLKDIWGSQFETLSFADQKWATSEAYGKEAIARYQKDGVEKLADLWDVSHKISKVAANPKLGPDGSYAKPSTGLSNKEHNVKNSPVTKPGQEQAQKGPAAPKPAEVKTETKIDMPGQEKGQTGPAAPKAKEVKTDYAEPKPEAEGKEVKTTPKNPEEKKMEKSEKEVETSYVAKGTEAMEAEEKGKKEEKSEKKASTVHCSLPDCDRVAHDNFEGKYYCPKHLPEKAKKEASVNYKQANAQIKWSSMTPEAQEFIKKHVEKHIKEDGMERAQAVAAAYSEAREKGMDVPEASKKSSQEPVMEKKAEEKPVEAVEGSTLPEGTKAFDAKPDEAVQGTTLPEEGKGKAPEETVADKPVCTTPNLTVAPEEAVVESTVPSGSKVEESVQKSAATEMPMPEDKPAIEEQVKDEVKVEEKPLDVLPAVEAPKVDVPVEPASAFDMADVLDIGEGYSAHKDKETKEVIIEKDGKEVKRLPDGFGADVAVVLPLMKAVLGLPPVEEVKPEVPAMAPPVEEKKEEPKMEEPKVEEHPALEEAHEDELGIKESALKVKETELIAKEAAIKAQEETLKKEAAAKHFAEVLKVRSERCKTLIASMVEKGAIEMDRTTYDAERANGTYLLDAQHKAFEAALSNKHKELIAMSDDSLLAMEKIVADLKAPVVKKASHIFASPAFTAEMSDDETLKRIFNTMGKPDQHPQ